MIFYLWLKELSLMTDPGRRRDEELIMLIKLGRQWNEQYHRMIWWYLL